jgi:molybdenum cofactor synthesis domain-containing protein
MARLKGFAKLTPINYALEQFFKSLKLEPLDSEAIPLKDGLDRIVSTDIRASVDVPNFNRSAVDGYAIRAEDAFGASATNPIILEVVGKIKIGLESTLSLERGEAIETTTGAQLPAGADAVVMMEHTRKIDDKHLEINSSTPPWKNVSRKGEDVTKNESVICRGTKLKPQHLGMVAALGCNEINVFRKPRVAVISTGSELVELGSKLEPGKIVDINRIILSNMVIEAGGKPIDLGIVRDDPLKIQDALKKGLKEADLVITSGGTSVGEMDLIPEAVNSLGNPGIIFHGISMRPGMPTGLANLNGKPVILLSGYPVAAIMGFETFAKPLILRMLYSPEEPAAVIKAVLTRRVVSSPGFRQFVRVLVKRTNKKYLAEPVYSAGSGILSSMIKANGLLVIPEDREGYDEGEEIEVTLFGQVE